MRHSEAATADLNTAEAAALTAIDLFCGAGGMSLGFERAGFDVRLAVDSDPIHARTYSGNFPATTCAELDLSEAAGQELLTRAGLDPGADALDVLFGGPPCQGFSYGGTWAPQDPRNRLLAHFGRLVSEARPRFFVLENVGGLTSRRMIHHLDALMARVAEAGYCVVEPVSVLRCQDVGIPQRRDRVIVLGHRDDQPAPGYPPPSHVELPTVWDAIGDLPNVDDFPYLRHSDILLAPLAPPPSEYAGLLRTWPDHSAEAGLSGCLSTNHSPAVRRRFADTVPGAFEPVSRFYRLAKEGTAPTLRAGTDSSRGSFTAPRPIHPEHPRCITVREAARLHGFPDSFTFHPTKWHGFRQVGNAVPPLLARSVALEIRSAAESSRMSLRLDTTTNREQT